MTGWEITEHEQAGRIVMDLTWCESYVIRMDVEQACDLLHALSERLSVPDTAEGLL